MRRSDKALVFAAVAVFTALLAALLLGYGEDAFLRMAEFYRACVESFGSL
ncbi:MAG: hypothetical protein WDZ84_07355 [Rhodovibrionaceae bacterium]